MKKLIISLLLLLLATGYWLPATAHASQNSLVVADGTGAAVRGGFNNAVNTLATLNSGTAAPGTTYAYMLWADTTNNLLKMRDSTNATWITLGKLGVANLGLFTGGTCTLTAGTTTTVSNTAVTASSQVFLFPTKLAATVTTLRVYVSGLSAGASFTLTHVGAAGTETFNYLIVN